MTEAMHDDVASELLRRQRPSIDSCINKQEREYLAKGFMTTAGLPFVASVELDVFDCLFLLDYFITSIKSFERLQECLQGLIAANHTIELDQILVRFVYKNIPVHHLYHHLF